MTEPAHPRSGLRAALLAAGTAGLLVVACDTPVPADGPGGDAAALGVARTMTFDPALRGDRPIDVRVQQAIHFRMPEGGEGDVESAPGGPADGELARADVFRITTEGGGSGEG